MLKRMLLIALFLVAAVPLANAAPPAGHAAIVPVRPAVPAFHAAGVVGPAFVGGAAKQQTGIVAGKPNMRHH